MKLIILAILLSFSSISVFSQDYIVLKSGNSYHCQITSEDSLNIYFIIPEENGKGISTFIEKENIQSIIRNDFGREYPMVSVERLQPKSTVRLSFIVPGLMLEKKASESSSIVFHLWAGISYTSTYSSITDQTRSSLHIYPNFTIEPRFYSHLEDRKIMGKRTDNFSGTYLGIPFTLTLTQPSLSAGPVFGFQRTLGSDGFWGFEFGVGLLENKNAMSVGLIGNFSLGFIL